MDKKLRLVRKFVESELSCSAHNMDHVMRVYNSSLHLAKSEKGIDLDVLRLAALLHDVARVNENTDKTGNTDHAVLGAITAEKLLNELGYPEQKIKQVTHCIISHRFRSGHKPKSKEAKILFDADKLDALGAVGLTRSFMAAGQYGERFYLDVPVKKYVRENIVENGRIKDIAKHALNLEFEVKFRHIPRRLHTKVAKRIANHRLKFMRQFFRRMRKEVTGDL